MAQSAKAGVVPPGDGPAYSIVGDVNTIKVTGAETGGAYALLEIRVPPGGGPPPHIHRREDEEFFILEGELTFFIEGNELKAPAGTFLHAPKNIPHAFKNTSASTARTLCWVWPAGLEKFFEEVGTRLPNSSAEPMPFDPAQVEKLLAAAPKYGLEILPPPKA